ncbi:ribosomal protein S5 domain 2-type protein [Chaetomidium leptoderma]|uniref:Small ribosomal subunit protein uS9m n=1 Tax=Chaetomidium leptoderma TaxID=669021 RepID=A0AAN6VM97_9PEZI|nr:ribosomal protein S5 domain 2-type protein [Chaetomidium leptoderma]
MMASSTRQGFTPALRGVSRTLNGTKRQPLEQQFQSLRLSPALVPGRRCMSTESGPTEEEGSIVAAPEINMRELYHRFKLAEHARAVPVSPSYFSRTPTFNDRYLALDRFSRTYGNLPVIPTTDTERIAWKTLADLRQSFGEPVKATDYVKCLTIIKRLHQIHPELKPNVVTEALREFERDVQAFLNVPTPIPIDKFGRALGVGKRKASTARAFVVEGEGQVLVNGKSLADYFGRVHDRESAVWALHATDRIDKYNVWARVEGGGTTGQAEALTLAISKALLAHEPGLKPALRRAGTVTRDPRRVERKKHGRVKARKGPTWVKR